MFVETFVSMNYFFFLKAKKSETNIPSFDHVD